MLHKILNNQYVSTIITVALALYASLLGPELPQYVKDLFNNTIFRIFILFMVVVRGNQDPKMAIMIAIAFVLTLDFIYVKSAKETMIPGSYSTRRIIRPEPYSRPHRQPEPYYEP